MPQDSTARLHGNGRQIGMQQLRGKYDYSLDKPATDHIRFMPAQWFL